MDCFDGRQIAPMQEWLLEYYTGRTSAEQALLLTQARRIWPAVEIKLMTYKSLTVRQAFLVMHEVVVEEFRRTYADLAARSKFIEAGEDIEETRAYLRDLQPTEPMAQETVDARNTSKLSAMESFGWVETDD